MKRIWLLFIIVLYFFPEFTYAHKFAKYNIVVDTDGGVDDFRALTYFMASRDYNINCITTVDGILNTQEAANYLGEVLKKYHHEGIPLGKGSNFNASKNYSGHALSHWKEFIPDVKAYNADDAVSLLYKSIKNEPKRTIIVAMGPLSNIAELLEKHSDISPKIEIILWYSDFDVKPYGYNFEQNIDVYNYIRKSNIPLKMLSGNNMKFSDDFFDACREIESVYSKTMVDFFKSKNSGGYYLWDDFLPLYLSYPTMFDEERIEDYLVKVSPKENSYYDILITTILNSEKPDEGVVFNEIPTSGFMLKKDINTVAEELIARHGYVEFKIVSLASEIHSHMGIYSILGAKMGLRIMEYIHAGLDEINIISYAGYQPPVSCLNDGLQVGTGSTIGYGAIKVDTTFGVKPEALIIYNERKILFRLKPEIIEEIGKDVGELIKAYGLNSDLYWSKLREISIEKYWLNMSRLDMFEIELLN